MYDYQCEKCGEKMERFVTFAERNAPTDHEDCGGKVVRAPFTKPPGVREKTRYGGMQALMVDQNEKVVGKMKGHFDKEAKKK